MSLSDGSVTSWTEEAARELSGCPRAAARRPCGAPEGSLAELQRALSGALAEASAGLRRAQEILDGGALGEAALREGQGIRPASPGGGSPPQLPGEVLRAAPRAPAAPSGSAPLLGPPDAAASGSPRAGAPRGSACSLEVPSRSSAAGARAAARAAGPPEPQGQPLPVELASRRQQHEDSVSVAESSPREASPRRRFEYSADILSHWSRIVAALDEMHSSGLSQIHSAWVEAKEFTLFVANPAHDQRRGAFAADPDAPALALGANFAFKKSSTRDSRKIGTLAADSEPEGLGRAWQVVRLLFLIVLPPFTRFRILWDLVGMALCVHDVTMFPALVFELSEDYLAFRLHFDWCSAVFWTLDILLNFRTGYMASDGLLEMRRDRVARHYIRSWFVPDLIVTIFDWVFLLISTGGTGILRVVKAVSRARRALRLLRMPKVNATFNQIVGAMNSESMSIVAGLVKFLLILILVTHYVACVWYWLADTDRRLTWRDRFLGSDDSEVYGYCTSMHWALTQFTPASMEVVPVNVPERLYTCIVIIFAMVVFSSFVSSITQAMTLLRVHHARKVEQEQLMRTYFSEFRINRGLAARCKFFMLQHARLAKKRIKESEIPCMQLLPKAIREELRHEALMPFLKTHPFFNFYMELCPVGMRHVCARATDEVSMLPLEEMFWHGQSVNRMFFVRIGMVSYCHRGHKTLPLEVTAGSWACEETLWSKASLVDGPFTAAYAGCELITVLPSEFQSIAKAHPGPLRFCASYAEVFIKEFNSASKNTECEDLLFNSPQTIKKIVREASGDKDGDGWSNVNRRFTGTRGLKSALWLANKKNRATLVRSYSTPIETKVDPVHNVNVIPSGDPGARSPRVTFDKGFSSKTQTKEFLIETSSKDFSTADTSGSNSPGIRRTIHIG